MSTDRPGITTLEIRVIPRAKRDELGGERAGRLLVRTTAAPSDGAANKAVCRLLADHFDVPPSAVAVIKGHHQRDKTVTITRPPRPRRGTPGEAAYAAGRSQVTPSKREKSLS